MERQKFNSPIRSILKYEMINRYFGFLVRKAKKSYMRLLPPVGFITKRYTDCRGIQKWLVRTPTTSNKIIISPL